MRSFVPDILVIVVFAGAALLVAMQTAPDFKAPPPPAAGALAAAPPQAPVVQRASGQGGPGKAFRNRNIFALSGSYLDSGKAVVPERIYELVAIVNDGGARALFRDYTGVVTRAAKGQKLADGFQVASIAADRVLLKKGKEKKEFRTFGAGPGEGEMKKAPGPQEPVLIGIMGGPEKKAVFRLPGGSVLALQASQLLPDGSVLKEIRDRSVLVGSGRKNRELVLYSPKHPAIPARQAPLPKELEEDGKQEEARPAANDRWPRIPQPRAEQAGAGPERGK